MDCTSYNQFCAPYYQNARPYPRGGRAITNGLSRFPGARVHCGWSMQKDTGLTSGQAGINLNLARNWRYVGTGVRIGQRGDVYVQWHHVSRIVSNLGGGCYMTSSTNLDGSKRYSRRCHALAIRRL